MNEADLIKFITYQFPVAAIIVLGLWRRWWYLGVYVQDMVAGWKQERERDDAQHAEAVAEKDKQIAFHDQLRQEAIEDKHAVEERTTKSREALEELTHVVRESIELNGEVVKRLDGAGRSKRPRSPRSLAHPQARARKNIGST